MSEATSTPQNACWACGYGIDSAADARDEDARPREGSWSVCLNCGAALVFRADLTVREPTRAELQAAPAELLRVQRVIFERGLLYERRGP